MLTKILFSSSIILSIPRVAVLVVYLTGVMFGGGLHLHESLSHEHESDLLHTHTWVAHFHNTTVFPFSGLKSESVAPVEDEHQHPVSLVQLIAVPASNLAPAKSSQHNISCSIDLPRAYSTNPSISILFVYPHETSPPLRSLAGSSDSGRSPPTA